MKNKFLLALFLFSGLFLFAGHSSAHQPRIVLGQTEIQVAEPEISKAYYGELAGQPDHFKIHSDAPFDLYVNILAPAVAGASKNFVVEIDKDGQTIATLDGSESTWEWYYEPFGGDNYWKGPEYDNAQAGAGDYEIKVSNPGNAGKYVLAVGQKEAFPVSEIANAIMLMPQIKRDFFGRSALAAFFNQDVLLFILILAVLFSSIFLLIKAFKLKRRKLGRKRP